MKKRFQKVIAWIKNKFRLVAPGRNAVKGAAWGLITFSLFLFVLFTVLMAYSIKDPWLLVLALGLLIATILFAYIGRWLLRLILAIPKFYLLAILFSIPLWFVSFPFQEVIIAGILLIGSLLGAAYGVLRYTGLTRLSTPKKWVTWIGLFLGLLLLAAGVYFYIPKGFDMEAPVNAALYQEPGILPILGETPAEKGPFGVKTFTYGSGEDRHRPEFGDSTDFKTDGVNGLAFIDNWKGISGWWRERYWGFDETKLPLNARVWYPEGNGPFPLVLIVHGNHIMQDYSDPGYAYLGELLASQGMIMVSVDQNFINASWSNLFGSLEKENDARGWLLLEHLKLWENENQTNNHPVFQKADMQNIALIGHSRGGEAVAHAALFNKLPYYPDDASVRFDYGFQIRSLIAIAPVDGQYQPSDTKTKLEDINYLVLHGSQDADVSSFLGANQFQRISFKDTSEYFFKSGLYIYGANHGQFNTSWGNNDVGTPFLGLLNLKQLMSGEAQREIAKVYISAFLQTTLQKKPEYLPLFQDARKGKDWLPETVYLNQFEDSRTNYLCTFEEDFDLSTTSIPGGKIEGKNLTVWKEEDLSLKWGKMGTKAVILGWDYKVEPKDTLEASDQKPIVPDSLLASYSLFLIPDSSTLKTNGLFIFSMAESTADSDPKSKGKWVKGNRNKPDSLKKISADQEAKKEKTSKEKDKQKQPIDLTFEMTDSQGQKLRFPLSRFSALQHQLEVKIWKADFIKGDSQSEKVFQRFAYDLEELQQDNPAFDIGSLSQIKLIFDLSPKGVVILDNIGFMQPFPALSAKHPD